MTESFRACCWSGAAPRASQMAGAQTGRERVGRVIARGAHGRMVGVRLDFGWSVLAATDRATQSSRWKYRRGGVGGRMLVMFAYWRYVIYGLLGPMRRVAAATST